MKSVNERRELKQWGGELISFAPSPSMKFGLSNEHIRKSHITARVETSDAGTRVTGTRVATMGVFALAAKKKKPDTVTVILVGDDYSETVEVKEPRARAKAEAFARDVNAINGATDAHGPDQGSTLDQLAKLGQLRDQGVLTEDEFNAQKTKILGGSA